MQTLKYIVALLLFALVCPAGAYAADATTAPTSRPAGVDNINPALKQSRDDLESGDPTRVAAAVKHIRDIIIAHRNDGMVFQGIDLLLKAQKFEDVDSACLTSMLSRDDAPYWVSKCQRARTLALMGEGKNEEALSAAKAYYNVALMSETSDAVNLVAQCLTKARPDEKDLAHRFKRQQYFWANPKYSPGTTRPATQPAGQEDLGEPILATIKIDPKPFQDKIDAIVLDKYGSYVARGNLLLLSDQAGDARDAFEGSMDKASEDQASNNRVAAAVQNIARAIRAQNGCLGPANAYIIALRDKAQPAK